MVLLGWVTVLSFIVTVLVIYVAGWLMYEWLHDKKFGKMIAAIITAALILVANMLIMALIA